MAEKAGNGKASIESWLGGIAEPEGDHAVAGWAAVAAARDFEAQGYPDAARRCLEKAVEFWERAQAAGEAITQQGQPGAQLARAEVLRRLGRFEEASIACHRGLAGRPQDPIRSLLELELELIDARDTTAHRVGEALFLDID